MAKKISIIGATVLIAFGALFAGGYWLMNRRAEQVCGFCQRHIKPEAAVVAEVGGRKRRVCCAHCAISEGRQEHKPVRLISVTDYTTSKPVKPEDAWYVDGSRVMACEHDMGHMDMSKQPQQLAFDRCAPGTFAFARREDAQAFVGRNGGVLRRLPGMLGQYAAPDASHAGEAQSK